jgi:hypothetical protein
MVALSPAMAEAQNIVSAKFVAPTERYDHGILGDAVEWGALEVWLAGGNRLRLVLPEDRVFEDIAPRLADVDGDGEAEIIVVETSLSLGARLSVYDESGLVAATPFIGRAYRWLAPVGAADLDGDGMSEIAYVDRPHLAKELRIWRFSEGTLVPVGRASEVTNHRIGDDYITGGIQTCGSEPQMIVVSADWRRILGVTFLGGTVARRDLGAYGGRATVDKVLACR